MNLKDIIKFAIKEDLGSGDITSNKIITDNKIISAIITSEQRGIFCGLKVLKELKNNFNLKISTKLKDGDKINTNDKIIKINGTAKDILASERLILNFLSFLSGISTETKKYTTLAKDVKILDTRKTVPLLRELQKYAVKVGGGYNHRLGLFDMVLIKDNHKQLIGLNLALTNAKNSKVDIEIECETIDEVKQALNHNVNIIMLDNMSTKQLKEAVRIIRQKPNIIIEASGGVTLNDIESIAGTGVDCISIGDLTSTIKPLKMKMEVIK